MYKYNCYNDKLIIIDKIETAQTAEQTDRIDNIRAEEKADLVGNVAKRSVVLYRIMSILLV